MISKSEQRELFLVLTVVGLFVSMAILGAGGFAMVGMAGVVMEEIKAKNTRALLEHLRFAWPASLVGSIVLLGTAYSYHRYRNLIAAQSSQ